MTDQRDEIDALDAEQEQVAGWVADVVLDHQNTYPMSIDYARCRCDGTVWEHPQWAEHVGREVVRAIARELDAVTIPPGSKHP